MSRENHKIIQNLKSAYFTGFSALQLWVQLWGGCNERKTITGSFDTKLSKMLQNKKREATFSVSSKHIKNQDYKFHTVYNL